MENNITGNEPIHPTGMNQSGTGLTKREHFAAMAMQGLMAGGLYESIINAHSKKLERLEDLVRTSPALASTQLLSPEQTLARTAIALTDALIAELNR